MKFFSKNVLVLGIFIFVTTIIFRQYIFNNKIPFPTNLLVSFYQPWASYKWAGYPNGPPSKPLGFDNLRIFYPSRSLVVNQFRHFQWPLWNPYNFSGNVLLGTYQSAIFFPLGFLFLFFPQIDAWSVIIILQPIFSGIFMYLFLRELALSRKASLCGGIVYTFSGIHIAWWEEMFMAGYSGMFFPLVFYAISRLFKKFTPGAFVLFVLSLSFSILSGWFQITFYLFIFSFLWVLVLFLSQRKQNIQTFYFLLFGYFLSLCISAICLLPGVEAYLHSPRGVQDIHSLFSEYLVNANHLITLIAPDFYGNPAVHNYFGNGFYHERVIYFGIPGLLLALYEYIYWKKNSVENIFFKIGAVVILSLGFYLPTTWFLLYALKIPLVSVILPTRIFFVFTFFIAIVASFGAERYLIKPNIKYIIFTISLVLLLFFIAWNIALFHHPLEAIHASVPIKNLILPLVIFILSGGFLLVGKAQKMRLISFIILMFLSVLGSVYFANKYLYFSERKFLYPQVPMLSQLQKISGINRFWSVQDAYIDRNFSMFYKLYSPEGYEPLYNSRYGQLLYSSHTHGVFSNNMPRADALLLQSDNLEHALSDPYRTKLLSLLGVEFLLDKHNNSSNSAMLGKNIPVKLVWTDGIFDIYRYTKALPRFFLANDSKVYTDKQAILSALYSPQVNLRQTILLEENQSNLSKKIALQGSTKLVSYSDNSLVIASIANQNALLFLSDAYYPGWVAYVDGNQTRILRADYAFRSIFVPKGKHTITFVYQPLSFYAGLVISCLSLIILGLIFFKLKGNRR